MASNVDRNDNGLDCTTTYWGCVKYFVKIFCTPEFIMVKPVYLTTSKISGCRRKNYLFKQPQPNPAELSGAFKRLQRIPG